MFQVAHSKQRRNDSAASAAREHTPAHSPGKQALTDQLHAAHLGAPSNFDRAIDNATREIHALKTVALPNFVAARRNNSLEPLAKEIELARVAMQVRHMLLMANQHVYALEKGQTYVDPIVTYLRNELDRLTEKAVKLGVYRGAEDMIPQRYIEPKKGQPGGDRHNVTHKRTPAPTPVQRTGLNPAAPARVTKPGNTRPASPAPTRVATPSPARIARGTSAPATRMAVQRKSTGPASAPRDVGAVASKGVESASAPLPFASTLQRAFGRHDLSSVRVQIGGAAAKASMKLGAKAYATGNLIAFESEPDLHTAAHEAAHVIQQHHGLGPSGEMDVAGDVHERHADEVADAVVRGQSAEAILDRAVGRGGSAHARVQRKAETAKASPQLDERDFRGPLTAAAYAAWNQAQILSAVRGRLRSAALPVPHARLQWTPGGVSGALERVLVETFGSGMDLAHRLPELLYPRDIYAIIDEHRDLVDGAKSSPASPARGARDWNPVVGQAVAIEVEACLRQSVLRMGPRYVAQADQYHGTVSAELLVASSPLDLVVAQLLCDPTVAHFIPEPGGKHASKARGADAKGTFKDGLRLVSLEWMGAKDPTLWNYVRVVDCPDATAEEVSAALYERGDGKNHTEYAYGLVMAHPFVRVPPAWARNMAGAKEYAPARDDEAKESSNLLGLADSAAAEEAASAQVGASKIRVDLKALASSINSIEGQLLMIGNDLKEWNLAHLVVPALRRATQQAETLRTTPEKAPSVWGAIVAEQEPVLGQVIEGILRVADAASAAKIKSHSSEAAPFRAVIEAYAIAAGESHLVQSARAQLAVAERKRSLLPLVLQELALRANHRVAQEMSAENPSAINTAGPQNPAADARAVNNTLELNLLDVRARILAGDASAAGQLEDLSVATAEATLKNRLTMLYDRVGKYEAALSTSDQGFAKVLNVALKPLPVEHPGAEQFAAADYHVLGAKLRGVQMRVAKILEQMQQAMLPKDLPNDIEGRRAALMAARKNAVSAAQAEFDKLADAEIEKMLKRAVQLIQDARMNQIVFDIALMIGISVVSAGAGAWVGGIVRGAVLAEAAADTSALAWSALGARGLGAAANMGVDAGIQAVAQTAVFGGNTGLSFVENIMANVMTLGALRPIHTLTGELGALDANVKGIYKAFANGRVAFVKVGTFTAEMLVGAGASYVAARLAHGKPKDDSEATSWALQGASMAVGHFVNRRLGSLNERLEQLGEHGMHLRARAQKQKALAAQLERTGDTEGALTLLEEHTALLKAERDLLANGHLLSQMGLDAKQVETLRAGNAAARAETDSQAIDTMKLRFHGLEPLGDGGRVWAGSRKDIDRLIADGGVAVKHLQEDRAPRFWDAEMGGRDVRLVETDPGDLRGPMARQTGVAGPDLHTHLMGVVDVNYFVSKLGGGKASVAFETVYRTFAADPKARKSAPQAWSAAHAAHEELAQMRKNGASPGSIEQRANDALTAMLAAGPETAFDQTYPVREAAVVAHIDPGDGPFRNYTRDSMEALAEEGIRYSEQSVGLGKLDTKFPEQMMRDLHGELAAKGKDVDVRFLAMVKTSALAGDAGENPAQTMRQVNAALSRSDVIGIDVAGPEKHAFTKEGMDNFEKLYVAVSTAAKLQNRTLVIRPHVGEGYNEGHGDAHAKLARQNLEILIKTLEQMGYSPANAAKDHVVVRFGHAAHATSLQIERMAKLGVIVEANIGSNVITRSIATADEHPLLFNLYYGVPTVLGTDGQGVMQTGRSKEYDAARRQLDRFVREGVGLRLHDNTVVYYENLSEKQRDQFSMEKLKSYEDEYHQRITAKDASNAGRRNQ